MYPGCDVEEACDTIEVSCPLTNPADCEPADLTVVNPDALPCYREQLVSSGPTALRWELPYAPDPGVAGQRAWLVLPGDGSVMTWHEAWGDGLYTFSAIESAWLRDDAALAACDGLPTPEDTLLCLFDIGSDTTLCKDGYAFPIG